MSRRRSRRATPSRVAQSRERAEAASAASGRSLAQAAGGGDREPQPAPVPPSRPGTPRRWVTPVVLPLAALTIMAGVYAYGPWARIGGTAWGGLAACLAVAGVLVWAGWYHWVLARPRHRMLAAVAAVGLTGVFLIGSATSVVIDGRVQLAGSEPAQAVALIRTIQDDLATIASYDRLLRLETAAARVEIDSYRPAADHLATMAGHYASMRVADLPSEAFVPVLRQVATAADFGSRALDAKRDLTLQYDTRLESTMVSWHQTYTEAVLTAGPQLADLARLYGFHLVDPDRDPVE